MSEPSVGINWSSDQRIFKFEVCTVHRLYLSANLNKGFQQNIQCLVLFKEEILTCDYKSSLFHIGNYKDTS